MYVCVCVCVCVYIYIYIYISKRLFSIIGYYKILNIIPCAIRSILVVYPFYIQSNFFFLYLLIQYF